MSNPLVLLHGYSDTSKGFQNWRDALITHKQLDPNKVHLINYVSLTNEISIRDIAEAFDRALVYEAGIAENDPFDAIVHSTGMLVIRAWLTRYASINGKINAQKIDQKRIKRLQHLIALAPATNGSPVAHKGRSWIGALVKGNRAIGRDFLESGHQVLSALELASPFTWDLGSKDMFGSGDNKRFKAGPESPFVFTICGDTGLGKIADAVTSAVGTKIRGSDGVVRWAGAALNCRLLTIDYTGEWSGEANKDGSSNVEIQASGWSNQNNKLILWPGLNHGSIMDPNKSPQLRELVGKALEVQDDNQFNDWNAEATKLASESRDQEPDKWQQLVIRVCDERGDGVTDWLVEVLIKRKNKAAEILDIDDIHAFSNERSYRCLHVNLSKCGLSDSSDIENIESFEMKLTMNTDSDYLHYVATRGGSYKSSEMIANGLSELIVDLKDYLNPQEGKFQLLMPYTTTFIEFRVNRDPLLEEDKGKILQVVKQ
ncbi:esterase/lipase family protein [Synechococcus sp. MIT S9507]|uniref:esterase/lipase family protein n=1 Tax=Synechococcus sp. MIT S9507 TaxID=3082544 RepID=UPI0039B4ADD8